MSCSYEWLNRYSWWICLGSTWGFAGYIYFTIADFMLECRSFILSEDDLNLFNFINIVIEWYYVMSKLQNIIDIFYIILKFTTINASKESTLTQKSLILIFIKNNMLFLMFWSLTLNIRSICSQLLSVW